MLRIIALTVKFRIDHDCPNGNDLSGLADKGRSTAQSLVGPRWANWTTIVRCSTSTTIVHYKPMSPVKAQATVFHAFDEERANRARGQAGVSTAIIAFGLPD